MRRETREWPREKLSREVNLPCHQIGHATPMIIIIGRAVADYFVLASARGSVAFRLGRQVYGV